MFSSRVLRGKTVGVPTKENNFRFNEDMELNPLQSNRLFDYGNEIHSQYK